MAVYSAEACGLSNQGWSGYGNLGLVLPKVKVINTGQRTWQKGSPLVQGEQEWGVRENLTWKVGGFEDKGKTRGLGQASAPSTSTRGWGADQNFWSLGKQGALSLVTSPEDSYQPSREQHTYLSQVAAPAASGSVLQPLGLRGARAWLTSNIFAYLEPSLCEMQTAGGDLQPYPGGWKLGNFFKEY